MKIGQRIKANGGFRGVVVANAIQSSHGYCPDGMVIVRLDRGTTVVALRDVEEDPECQLQN